MKASIIFCLVLAIVLWSAAPVGKCMTLGTHFTVGAGLAYYFADNELEAFGIGLASHALLDSLPHNDRSKTISVLSALGAVLMVYDLAVNKNADMSVVFTGGAAGMLPDSEHFLKRHGIIDHSYYPSHNGQIYQPRTEPDNAFFMELAVSVAVFHITF